MERRPGPEGGGRPGPKGIGALVIDGEPLTPIATDRARRPMLPPVMGADPVWSLSVQYAPHTTHRRHRKNRET